MKLIPIDVEKAAEDLGCNQKQIRAVIEIEGKGGWFTDIRRKILDSKDIRGGFLVADKQPAILYEAHIFSRLTDHRYDRDYPQISSRSWNRDLYYGGSREYERLNVAIAVERDPALQACSWGLFQILGMNYGVCGYDSVEDFVADMYKSEGKQLQAFVGFIQGNRLTQATRKISSQPEDCKDFARGYNGPGYRDNNYHVKLARAYWNLTRQAPYGITIRDAQTLLNASNSKPRLAVDGIFGPKTSSSISFYQEQRGLNITGKLNQETIDSLTKDD